jgi:hypothetical protein
MPHFDQQLRKLFFQRGNQVRCDFEVALVPAPVCAALDSGARELLQHNLEIFGGRRV